MAIEKDFFRRLDEFYCCFLFSLFSTSETGGIVLFLNKHKRFRVGYYVPPIGWNSLAVRLFLRGESSEIFVPVYPEDGNATAEVKVWEIHYPPDIKSNPKYIETEH